LKGAGSDRISVILAFVGLLLPPAWWLAVIFGIVGTVRSGGRRWWGLGCCLASLVVAVIIRMALLR
jgi:spore maturation protein SpmB